MHLTCCVYFASACTSSEYLPSCRPSCNLRCKVGPLCQGRSSDYQLHALQTTERFEKTPTLKTGNPAANYAPYQPAFQRKPPLLMTTGHPTGYPTGAMPQHGSFAAMSQSTCWNTDWLFCVLGLLCTPFWVAGACHPLCRRPKWLTTSSKIGWAFNLVLSIALTALVIAAIIIAVKAVKKDMADIKNAYGDSSGSTVPTGIEYSGSICSLAQETCSTNADCCSNTDAASGLICTIDAAGAPLCLVKRSYACSQDRDCLCFSGCPGQNMSCSQLPMTLHTCQPVA